MDQPASQADARTFAALVLTVLIGAVANASGVGGGAIYLPLFHALVGFEMKPSTALSQAAITAGAVMQVALNLLKAHPLRRDLPLVDFTLTLALTPVMLVGVGIGVVLNVMLPTLVITVLLLVLLLLLALQTAHKGRALWRQESAKKRSNAAAEAGGAAVADGRSPTALPRPRPPAGAGGVPLQDMCRQRNRSVGPGVRRPLERAEGEATSTVQGGLEEAVVTVATGRDVRGGIESAAAAAAACMPRTPPRLAWLAQPASLESRGGEGTNTDGAADSPNALRRPHDVAGGPSAAHVTIELPLLLHGDRDDGREPRGRSRSEGPPHDDDPHRDPHRHVPLALHDLLLAFNELGVSHLGHHAAHDEWPCIAVSSAPAVALAARRGSDGGGATPDADTDRDAGRAPLTARALVDFGMARRGMRLMASHAPTVPERVGPKAREADAAVGEQSSWMMRRSRWRRKAAAFPPSPRRVAAGGASDPNLRSPSIRDAGVTSASPLLAYDGLRQELAMSQERPWGGAPPYGSGPCTSISVNQDTQQQQQQRQGWLGFDSEQRAAPSAGGGVGADVRPHADQAHDDDQGRGWQAQADAASRAGAFRDSKRGAEPALRQSSGSSSRVSAHEVYGGGRFGGATLGGSGGAALRSWPDGDTADRVPTDPGIASSNGGGWLGRAQAALLRLPLRLVAAVLVVWGVYLALQAVRSVVVSKCSPGWWALFAVQIVAMIAASCAMVLALKAQAGRAVGGVRHLFSRVSPKDEADHAAAQELGEVQQQQLQQQQQEDLQRWALRPSELSGSSRTGQRNPLFSYDSQRFRPSSAGGGTAAAAGGGSWSLTVLGMASPHLSGKGRPPSVDPTASPAAAGAAAPAAGLAPPLSPACGAAPGPAGGGCSPSASAAGIGTAPEEAGAGPVARSGTAAAAGLAQQCQDNISSAAVLLAAPFRNLAITFLAGLAGGMLGLGGGMVMGPLLLHLGVQPQVAAATSGAMVLFSSSTALIQFALLGRLNLPYAGVFGAASVLASITGVTLVAGAVRRSGRPSIVVFALVSVMLTGAVFVGMFGLRSAVRGVQQGALGFTGLCAA